MLFQRKVFAVSLGGLLSLGAALTTGCRSTTPGAPDFEAAEVIERIGGADETPAWATGAVALEEKDGMVAFISMSSMAGDARVEACMRAAEEGARANMMRHIRDGITTSGQVSELSASSDPGVEALTAFLAQGHVSGVKVAERYWEKRVESASSGARVLKLNCAAKVAIDKTNLEKQLRDAISGPSGNPEIREKLLNAQKTFIENLGKESAAN